MSEHPFVDTPVPSIDDAMAAAALAAAVWGLPSPQLLRRGMNVIASAGSDVVLRVSTPTAPAEEAVWLAGLLADAGIRVPRPLRTEVVRHGGYSVVAIERVRESTSVDWRTVGAMMRRVHTIAVDDIRGHHPLPMAGAFPWWQLDGLLDEVADLVDVAAHRGLVAAADRVRGWDVDLTDLVVCHGDVHPGNVLGGPDGPVLIDWDLLCAGPTAWDHAPLLTWATRWGGRPGTYEAFAAGYGWSASTDALAARLAEGRLVAATLLRLRAGRTDPSAAAEAQRRLSYWRGDADAPPWRAM